MRPQPPAKPEPDKVNVSDGRLTALERAIEKSEIDLAACIKATGGLCLRVAMGIAIVVAAASGDFVTVDDLIAVAHSWSGDGVRTP